MSFSPTDEVLLVSHDAGAAEILSALVKSCPGPKFRFFLAGPALAIFQRKIPGIPVLSETEAWEALSGCTRLITGTSWGSDSERRFLARSREIGRFSITFLDHWNEYPQRFLWNSRLVLPDEIWVGDEHAERLARAQFPQTVIRHVPNPFFREIETRLALFPKRAPDATRPEILYICEPRLEVSLKKYGRPDYWKYDEYEAMRGFFRWLQSSSASRAKVTVRLHPSERREKYAGVLREFEGSLLIGTSEEADPLADIARSDWVCGCDSMALVIGLLAHKRVISCIPPGGRPLTLPFPEIQTLFAPSPPG